MKDLKAMDPRKRAVTRALMKALDDNEDATFGQMSDAVLATLPKSIDAVHLTRQRDWSRKTFGPGARVEGVIDHIRKELLELLDAPTDLSEWADVIILGFDGALRSGADPQAIIDAVLDKHAKNEARTWPDWRTQPANKAIEHVRDEECPHNEDAASCAGHCTEKTWQAICEVPGCDWESLPYADYPDASHAGFVHWEDLGHGSHIMTATTTAYPRNDRHAIVELTIPMIPRPCRGCGVGEGVMHLDNCPAVVEAVGALDMEPWADDPK